MLKAKIGQPAPALPVSKWLQGEALDFSKRSGRVILIEVFQVNCPGCFLYSLPKAVELYNRYASQGLVVAAVATAFEDFDKNTEENLKLLLEKGEVIGETLRYLTHYQRLDHGRLMFKIPFPVAMDQLVSRQADTTGSEIESFIYQRVPDFHAQSQEDQRAIWIKAENYLQNLRYSAKTFETFGLQGTPSHILIDKQGLLRACRFGAYPELEADIQALLQVKA